MQHPFITDLSEKTLEEIQNTLMSLHTKLSFAYKTGNGQLISQLQMAIESYRNEQTKKMDEMFKKQNIKTKIDIKKENER